MLIYYKILYLRKFCSASWFKINRKRAFCKTYLNNRFFEVVAKYKLKNLLNILEIHHTSQYI